MRTLDRRIQRLESIFPACSQDDYLDIAFRLAMRRLTDEELGIFEASLIAIQSLPAPKTEQIVAQLTPEQVVVAEKYSRFVEEERQLRNEPSGRAERNR